MAGARVNIRDSAVYAAFAPIARDRLTIIGNEAVAVAGELVGEKTGDLKRSIGWEPHWSLVRPSVTVFAATPYAYIHHEGASPHLIVGNYYLRFYWERIGRRIVIHLVNHPGHGPNPFLRNAVFAVVQKDLTVTPSRRL